MWELHWWGIGKLIGEPYEEVFWDFGEKKLTVAAVVPKNEI